MHVSFIALLACNFTIFVELEVIHEGFIRRLILRLIKGAAASVWWRLFQGVALLAVRIESISEASRAGSAGTVFLHGRLR